MSDRFDRSSNQTSFKALEDDKYIKVFRHLESVSLRNKAAFDELLKYTYSNINQTNSNNPNNQRR